MAYIRGQIIAVAIVSIALLSAKSAQAGSVILQNFSGIGQTNAVPPDMGGAVGGNFVVQIVNGGMKITTNTGAVAQTQISDSQFWANAGISTGTLASGISDPRVVFDSSSQRFFVSEITVEQTPNVGNRVLLAVSKSADPTQGFSAVSFPGFGTGTAPLADFPTLGVDQNSIYVGTNNFSNNSTFSSVSFFAVPKTSFVASQSLASMTRFDNLNPNIVGFTLQGVTSATASSKIFAIDTSMDFLDITPIIGAGSSNATLGSTQYVSGLFDGTPFRQRQPDGSRTLDAGDRRVGAVVYQAGNYIYAANAIGVSAGGSDAVHWMIFNATTNALVSQGLISDPNFDFTYPSIAANASGDFLLAYNRSGSASPSGLISSFGTICHLNTGTNAVACDNPLLLQASTVSYTESHQRWGDYSAAQVDPDNSNNFWAFTEYAVNTTDWGTRITEIGMVAPEPGSLFSMGAAFAGLLLFSRRCRAT